MGVKRWLQETEVFVSGDVVRFLPKKDQPEVENPKPSVNISNIVNEEDIPF